MSLSISRQAWAPKKLLAGLLLLVLSGMFLFSAYAKLTSLEVFDWTIRDAGVKNETVSAIAAQAIVGLEILLGLALLFRVALRTFTLPAVVILLILFSGYLGYGISRNGWDGDCGCYGALYSMSPGWALMRNVAMIGGALFLFALPPFRAYRGMNILTGLIVVAAVSLPLIFSSKEAKPTPIDLSPVYALAQPRPTTDLKKGRHLIAFFSLGCPHCRTAAKTLSQIQQEAPALPIFMVLNGGPKGLENFMQDTKAGSVPYALMQDTEAFVQMAGKYVPAIFFVENSTVVRRLRYTALSRAAIENWTRQ